LTSDPSILHCSSNPTSVTKSAEMLWLDAIEANENGSREDALGMAKEVVQIDEEHSEAWMAIAEWSLPLPTRGTRAMPSLVQASKAMSAIRRVVEFDPDNSEGWNLGGRILTDDLGMLEHALEWWEERRGVAPNDIVPLIEQLSILVRLGYFEEGESRLQVLEGLNTGPNRAIESRIARIRGMFDRARKLEGDTVFEPQNEKDERWEFIRNMRKRKPMSETFFLLTFVMPVVFLIGSVVMMMIGSMRFGIFIVMFIIIVLYLIVLNLSKGLLNRLNRYALDLERALDVETTTGKMCIPEEIRGSKLYNHILLSKTGGLKERLVLIVEAGEEISSKWDLETPF